MFGNASINVDKKTKGAKCFQLQKLSLVHLFRNKVKDQTRGDIYILDVGKYGLHIHVLKKFLSTPIVVGQTPRVAQLA